MRSLVVGVITLSGAIVATSSGIAADSSANNHEASTLDPSEVICIEMSAPTGSRVPDGKVCHTRLEWAVIHRSGVDLVRMYDRNMPSSNVPSGAMH